MRQIKFRAFCDIGDGNKMLYFTEGKYDNGLWFEHTSNHIDEYLSPLMQFTGLTDKNGAEVFEGDLLKTRYGTIFYYNDLVDYHLWDINNSIAFSEVEIIGNIYSNPELLK